MKKNLLTISFILLSAHIFAQSFDSILTRSEFRSVISKLTGKVKTLEKNNSDLQQKKSNQKKQIEIGGHKFSKQPVCLWDRSEKL